MQYEKFQEKFNKLIAEYTGEFFALSNPVANEVIKLLSEGKTASDAVSLALEKYQFFGRNEAVLINILFQAAAAGAGVEPNRIAHPAQVKRILLHEAWSPDQMNLSTRLHGVNQTMKREIVDTIQTAMKRQESFTQMSRALFDGYNSGSKVIKDAELPEYLESLKQAAKRAAGGDYKSLRKFNIAHKRALHAINNLAGNDAPTLGLKVGYSNIVEAAKALATGSLTDAQARKLNRQGLGSIVELKAAINELNQKALEKAVWVGIQEKSRYHADRIARTELAEAYGEAFFAQNANDPDVIAYRWQLSDRHSKTDICDFNAKADLYGLGAGVYPKKKFPHYPAHPHCLCPFSEVYEGRIDMDFSREAKKLDNARFSESAGRKFINGLSKQEQEALLGAEGLKAFRRGESWQNYLTGWQEHSNPCRRFTSANFHTNTGKNDFTAGRNKVTIKTDMENQAEQLRKQLLENGLTWKPGSLDVHFTKRKMSRQIPANWTADDYTNKILSILRNKETEVYSYYQEGFRQKFFVYGLPDWIVIVGEDGIMETAFTVDRDLKYNEYLTEARGYTRLNMKGEY